MLIDRIEEDPTAEFPTIPERRPRVHVAFGGGTHPGHFRSRNEDQYLIAKLAKSMRICASSLPESETTRFADEEGYLLIVADGMGGSAGGQEASTMAVRTVESFVLDAIKWFLHREGHDQNALVSELRLALQRADSDVLARADADPRSLWHGNDADDVLQRGYRPVCGPRRRFTSLPPPGRPARANHIRPHARSGAGRRRRNHAGRRARTSPPSRCHQRCGRPQPWCPGGSPPPYPGRWRYRAALHRRPDRVSCRSRDRRDPCPISQIPNKQPDA